MNEVQDINQLAATLDEWHTSVLAQLEHVASIPDEVDVTITLADGEPYTLQTDNERSSYVAGIKDAIGLVQSFPLVVERVPMKVLDLG